MSDPWDELDAADATGPIGTQAEEPADDLCPTCKHPTHAVSWCLAADPDDRWSDSADACQCEDGEEPDTAEDARP